MTIPIAEDLKGKVAIVTGAGSRPGEGVGNGRAAAILLARAGAHVVLADANAGWAEDTRRMIAEEGGAEGVVVAADVTQPGGLRPHRRDRRGPLGPAGCAGQQCRHQRPAKAIDADHAAWTHGLPVNVTSMMLMAKYAVPADAEDRRRRHREHRLGRRAEGRPSHLCCIPPARARW